MKRKKRHNVLMKQLKKIIEQQLRDFDDAAFLRLMRVFSAIALAIIGYAAVFSGFQIVDEFEHLHASWLVSCGKIPYQDFLEHHHPLLWYLSAPIMRVFYDNVIVFYVMRGVSAATSLGVAFYLYKIVLFWGDKRCGWLALAFYLGNLITFYTFYQFRPDNFMHLCFMAGLYYLFVALKTKRIRDLSISFLCFTAAFLFLQKIAFLLMLIELILLILIFIKKVKIKDVVIAALPSLLVLALFLGYFYLKGALVEYFEFNFTLNRAMLDFYQRGNFWYSYFCLSIYGAAAMCALYFYKKENVYFKIAAVLYLAEFLMRGFYFAPHTHYYALATILSAMVLSVLGQKLMPRHKIAMSAMVTLMFIYLGYGFNRLENGIDTYNSYRHYQMADWAHKNSYKEDVLMNGYDTIFNIYRKDTGYFWFSLDTLAPMMIREYNLNKKIDVNEMILSYRPKFVYAADYPDLAALRLYGEKRYAQQFMPEIIYHLYKPTPFKRLYELK